MTDIAIRVEGLSKLYSIGARRERYDMLREDLSKRLTWPFRTLSSLFSRDGSRPSAVDPHRPSPSSRDSTLDPSTIWALKDVSFEVKEGEVIGVIGRNGAGKSTLLKILSRITEPTEGYAEVRGRVGSILEMSTGFHPELTGGENIYLNGAILGMRKAEIERKFDEIVAFAEVERFIDTPVKHYSTGMRVRLGFAVAAHLETEILLVDEVLAVGDAAFQEKCLGKMGNVASGGRTVLFVSHNMAAVRALCGSAMLLSEGQKVRVCDGSVDAVIAKYLQATIGEGRSGELVPSMHKGGSAELWVREVILTNGVGEPVSQLRIGEPMTITVLFEARQPFREARIGLGFITIEGTRIAAVYHTDRGLPALSANSGEYEVSFTLLNPFLPGSYIISAGAHRALGGTLIDDVPEALRFHVVDVSAGEDMPQSYNRGVVSLDGAWQPPQRIGG